jgi:hypothetical protein
MTFLIVLLAGGCFIFLAGAITDHTAVAAIGALFAIVSALAIRDLSEARQKTKSNIEIIHPVESIRCVSQDSKIVFCESYRE